MNGMLRLGDVCEFLYGKSLPAPERKKGDYLVYGSNGAVGNHDEAVTKSPSIIVGRKGSVGKLIYSERPCWPIDTTYYIDSENTDADLKWLFYAMSSLRLDELNKATGVPGLNRNDAYERKLFVPASIDEQRRIAKILDEAERIRRKYQQALALIDDFLNSLFVEMFGDPVVNQRGYEPTVLEKLCQVITDCLHTTPKHFPEPNRYPSIRSSELQNGFIDLSEAKYVKEEEYRVRVQRHTPVPGDLIYCREGARYGNVGLVENGMTPCLGQRTMLFQAKEGAATSEFLWFLLRSDAMKRQADNCVGGAAAPHINIKDIRNFVCVKPPYPLQEKFSGIVQLYLAARKRLHTSLSEANSFFAAISQRAFRGEL